MNLSILFKRALNWLQWLVLPPPWWVVWGVAALVVAVFLCIQYSYWAAAVAVAYQIAGAALALFQFVSLQKGFNSEWWLRELRAWWAERPIRRNYSLKVDSAIHWQTASPARLSVWPGPGTPQDEQLRLIWEKLKEMTTEMDTLGQDIQRREADLLRLVESNHKAALGAASEAKESLSSALTSAPLMAVTGFWLILLGLGMQVWLAVVAIP